MHEPSARQRRFQERVRPKNHSPPRTAALAASGSGASHAARETSADPGMHGTSRTHAAAIPPLSGKASRDGSFLAARSGSPSQVSSGAKRPYHLVSGGRQVAIAPGRRRAPAFSIPPEVALAARVLASPSIPPAHAILSAVLGSLCLVCGQAALGAQVDAEVRLIQSGCPGWAPLLAPATAAALRALPFSRALGALRQGSAEWFAALRRGLCDPHAPDD